MRLQPPQTLGKVFAKEKLVGRFLIDIPLNTFKHSRIWYVDVCWMSGFHILIHVSDLETKILRVASIGMMRFTKKYGDADLSIPFLFQQESSRRLP